MHNLLSSAEIENKIKYSHNNNKKTLAIIPVGCTEQHGPFLPIQADTIISENFSRHLTDAISGSYWGYVFPAICYTPTKSNSNYAGTVSVGENQLRHYVIQICESMLGQEFDAIILVSGHGPVDPSLNEICFNLVHEQYLQKCSMIKPVLLVSLSECRTILEKKFGQKSGKHADWIEMLYLMYILGEHFFDQKKLDDILDFQKKNSFSITDPPVLGIPMEFKSVQGVIGDPAPASNENWNILAKIAWNEAIEYFKSSLQQKLSAFWSKSYVERSKTSN